MFESDNRWYLDKQKDDAVLDPRTGKKYDVVNAVEQFNAAQTAQTRRTRKPCVVTLMRAAADCGHTLREDKTAVMIDGKSHCVDCAFARVTA